VLAEHVQATIARIMGLDSCSQLEGSGRLRDKGIDSILAITLRNALRDDFGYNFPATLVFDHPTVDAIVELIADTVLKLPAGREVAAPEAASVAPDATAGRGGLEDLLAEAERMSAASKSR